jgi:glycosyltransferase involved in cell wall biosynthesis
MRALPKIMEERPNVQVIIVGNHEVSYGKKPPKDTCYKDIYLDEVKDELDLSRVHFLGAISYVDYLNVLQVSRAHIYLTYPFVLSWSVLEALSMGCVIIGSDTTPVQEVITDKENGILVNFFDKEQIAKQTIDVLAKPENYKHIKQNARKYAVENFDFKTVSLTKYKQLINDLTH